jgi:hypothetical protein
MLKIVVEIGQIVVPTFKTDLGYLLIGFRQQFGRYAYPNTFYIFHKGKICLLLEIPAK